MNNRIASLQPYPFQKLANLFANVTPPADKTKILLSLGEPKHLPPQFVLNKLADSLDALAHYPVAHGLSELRTAICSWLAKRFAISNELLDPAQHVLPVAGTREALFSFAQAIIDTNQPEKPLALMPNPFYQIYEGAALLAGAEPYFLNTDKTNHYQVNLDAVPDQVWQRAQLIYICTPGNPTGAVLNRESLKKLINLADKFDFIIASDECYSEIYFDDKSPPPGLLEVAAAMGVTDFSRCIVFHSLSKRSNLPGLRSGFAAGDATILKKYLQYRTYHGAALPVPTQLASIQAWSDEAHVIKNREMYRQKFAAVLDILGSVLTVQQPEAGFYLWAETPINDEDFAQQLYANENIVVLPGSYLSRDTEAGNPGENYIRMALVASVEESIDAAKRIKNFTETI
ncbi:MAG: succinyldiaminopimelate transaminase [Acidiferrobacterales bacterium]